MAEEKNRVGHSWRIFVTPGSGIELRIDKTGHLADKDFIFVGSERQAVKEAVRRAKLFFHNESVYIGRQDEPNKLIRTEIRGHSIASRARHYIRCACHPILTVKYFREIWLKKKGRVRFNGPHSPKLPLFAEVEGKRFEGEDVFKVATFRKTYITEYNKSRCEIVTRCEESWEWL